MISGDDSTRRKAVHCKRLSSKSYQLGCELEVSSSRFRTVGKQSNVVMHIIFSSRVTIDYGNRGDLFFKDGNFITLGWLIILANLQNIN